MPSVPASESLGRRTSDGRESVDRRVSAGGRSSEECLGAEAAGDVGLDAPACSASFILAMAGSGGDAEADTVFLFL